MAVEGNRNGSEEVVARSVVEAGPLLEHTRWVLSDLAARVESFNQRAGVLLGISVAVAALAVPSAASLFTGLVAWAAGGVVLAAFAMPIGLALATLHVRSSHGIGPKVIDSRLGPDGYPIGDRGEHIERDLLRGLTSPSDSGAPSVLADLNRQCRVKADLLTWTQWALVGAPVVAALGVAGVAVLNVLLSTC